MQKSNVIFFLELEFLEEPLGALFCAAQNGLFSQEGLALKYFIFYF
jgi:hypothetical protein